MVFRAAELLEVRIIAKQDLLNFILENAILVQVPQM